MKLTDGGEESYRGRLVVGADGYRSRVAELAGVPQRVDRNGRFLCFGYYRGVRRSWPTPFRLWFRGADIVAAGGTDGGLTQVALMLTNDQLPAFQADRAAATEAYLATLPGAPEVATGEPFGKRLLATDYSLIQRHPTPRPGLALIGDAALTTDPVPAPGCGFAFRGAEMLARATAGALTAGTDVDRALRRYAREFRFVQRHHRLIRDGARGEPPNRLLRLLRRAATYDPQLAQRMYLFGMRAIPVTGLLNPAVISRALWVAGRAPRPAPGRPAVAATEP